VDRHRDSGSDYDVTNTCEVMHEYEVRQRRDKRGVNLISDALPKKVLWIRRRQGRDAV
jgi:hypothetical protein